MTERSDDELYQHLVAKWTKEAEKTPLARLSGEEQRVAERLVGKDNAQRLSRARDGQRVRITPVVIRFEWYQFGETQAALGGWRIERVTNGRREHYREGQFEDDLQAQLAKLRQANQSVMRVRMEGERDEPTSKPSLKPTRQGRGSLDWMKGFRP